MSWLETHYAKGFLWKTVWLACGSQWLKLSVTCSQSSSGEVLAPAVLNIPITGPEDSTECSCCSRFVCDTTGGVAWSERNSHSTERWDWVVKRCARFHKRKCEFLLLGCSNPKQKHRLRSVWRSPLVPGGQQRWAWARGMLQQQGKVVLGQIRTNFMLAVTPIWNMHSQTHILCLTGHYFFTFRFHLLNHLFHSDASDVCIPILDSCRTALSSSGFLTSGCLYLVLWKALFFSLRWYFPTYTSDI